MGCGNSSATTTSTPNETTATNKNNNKPQDGEEIKADSNTKITKKSSCSPPSSEKNSSSSSLSHNTQKRNNNNNTQFATISSNRDVDDSNSNSISQSASPIPQLPQSRNHRQSSSNDDACCTSQTPSPGNSTSTMQGITPAQPTYLTELDPAIFFLDSTPSDDTTAVAAVLKKHLPAFTRALDKSSDATGAFVNALDPTHALHAALRSYPTQYARDITARCLLKSVHSMFEACRSYSLTSGGAPDVDATRFTASGFEYLAEQLGVDLSTDALSLLVLTFMCKCAVSWEMGLEEWIVGTTAARAYSFPSLKRSVASQLSVLTDPKRTPTDSESFRDFYRFCFVFNRENNARYVDTPTAVPIWRPLLSTGRRWCDIDLWCTFLEGDAASSRYKTISIDQWLQVLEYAIVLNGKSIADGTHDATQAWPCVIDDFVEWGVPRAAAAQNKMLNK